jgi:Flp pilus assembly protein CpaB
MGRGRRAAWRRFALRRGLAAAFAGLAVLGGLGALQAQTAPTTSAVVVARTDLPGGQRITASDVEVRAWPVSVAPRGAVSDPGLVVGRVLASSVGPGEALTPSRLVGPGLLEGQAPGVVAAVVPLLDGAAGLLARPGVRVDVVTPSGEVVARDAVVLAVPQGADRSTAGWGSGGSEPDSVVVAVESAVAPALARGGGGDAPGGGSGFALLLHPQ